MCPDHLCTSRQALVITDCRGLWRGTSPTVARLALGVGVHFLALEFIKDAIYHISAKGKGHKHGELSPFQAFMSGGLSRGVAAAITCPVTVVKTRMEYVGSAGIRYKVSWHALSTGWGCNSMLAACCIFLILTESNALSGAEM